MGRPPKEKIEEEDTNDKWEEEEERIEKKNPFAFLKPGNKKVVDLTPELEREIAENAKIDFARSFKIGSLFIKEEDNGILKTFLPYILIGVSAITLIVVIAK